MTGMRNAVLIAMPLVTLASMLTGPKARAGGLDVQLKDLRGSYFYVMREAASTAKECAKLALADTKKYGRLTHCDPEQNHVLCKTKTGEKLFAFETKELCEASLKTGTEPVESDD